ncbi:MAG: TonB family protein [Acidobacteria bacterium]|nr:TonB family protein [Acidobacteriota bacterium]
MRQLSIILVLLSAGTLASAQNSLEPIFRKAPEKYPPAAEVVRAEGQVIVAIEIAPEGNVSSAKVISGHPLLRAISAQAAREWRFAPVADSEVRTVVLQFHYTHGGWFTIEQGEVERVTRTESSFESSFVVKVSVGTYAPKTLLLPRKDGVIKDRYCEVHNRLMEVEIQSVSYGLIARFSDEDDYFERYDRAEETFFPNANLESNRGCVDTGIENEETYFCSTCRVEREKWLKQNEGK